MTALTKLNERSDRLENSQQKKKNQSTKEEEIIRTLRIITWTTNGLVQRKQELEHFINNEKTDISLISETHFTTWTTLKYCDYQINTTKHPSNRTHGETAVIIKESI